jgi:hypothetical protein
MSSGKIGFFISRVPPGEALSKNIVQFPFWPKKAIAMPMGPGARTSHCQRDKNMIEFISEQFCSK